MHSPLASETEAQRAHCDSIPPHEEWYRSTPIASGVRDPHRMIRCLKQRPLLLASTPTDGRNQCPCTYFDLPKELMATLGCLSHYGYKGLSERMLGRDEVFVSASESIQIAIVWECSELSPWPSIASAAREDKIPRHVNVDAQPSCHQRMRKEVINIDCFRRVQGCEADWPEAVEAVSLLIAV